jgi:hypothetical protein
MTQVMSGDTSTPPRRRFNRTHTAMVVTWLVTRAAAAVAVLTVVWGHERWLPGWVLGDVTGDYYRAGHALAAGLMPYHQFRYEYPPGTLPFLALAALARSPGGFATAWVVMMLVLDAAVAALLATWPQRASGRGTWLWLAVPVLLGPFVYLRNDLAVVAAVVAATRMHRRRDLASGAVWMFAVAVKVWPAALLLLYAATAARRRRFAAGVAGVAVATVGYLLAAHAAGAAWRQLIAYQGQRPLELESTAAAALLVAARGRHLKEVLSFQSFNLVTPAARHLAAISYRMVEAVQAALATAATTLVALRRQPAPRLLAWAAAAFTATVVVVAPVLSPQYLLWVLGAVAVAGTLDGCRSVAATVTLTAAAAAAVLTQIGFPWRFDELLAQRQPAVGLVAARDGVLAAVAVAAWGLTCRAAHDAA